MHTTLNRIREYGPCTEGWRNLLSCLNKTQADAEPVSLLTILNATDHEDFQWVVSSLPEFEGIAKELSMHIVRQIEHMHPKGKEMLDLVEEFHDGIRDWSEHSAAFIRLKGEDVNLTQSQRDMASAAWEASYSSLDGSYVIYTQVTLEREKNPEADFEALHQKYKGLLEETYRKWLTEKMEQLP